MSIQNWQETLAYQAASGTLFNTYTTAKSVINPTALWQMPANYLFPGRSLRVTVKGSVSNIVTTPGTMNFQIKGGPTSNIAIFDTGAIQLNATAHTTLPFWLDIEMRCDAIGNGTTAKMIGLSQVTGRMFTLTAGQTDDAQGMQTLIAPATAIAQGTGFDSTVVNIIDFWVGFSISNAGNGVQVHTYRLESLN